MRYDRDDEAIVTGRRSSSLVSVAGQGAEVLAPWSGLAGSPIPDGNRPHGSTESCPCRPTLDRIADRWSAEIIGLLVGGPRCAGELQRATGASRKVLTQTLRGLERDGLVERDVLSGRLVRVSYSLTLLGASLAGPLATVRDWSQRHLPAVAAAQADYDARQREPSVTELRQRDAVRRAASPSRGRHPQVPSVGATRTGAGSDSY